MGRGVECSMSVAGGIVWYHSEEMWVCGHRGIVHNSVTSG